MKTKIYRIGTDADENVFKECGNILRDGGLVAFPTETVYGLGVCAFRGESVKKVFEAKGRPSDNPLIVHIAYPEDAENIAVTCPLYYELAEKFMPGPITVILPKKDNIPKEVTGGLDSVGIRCPSCESAHRLIIAAECPIPAPSANISGLPSPTEGAHVIKDMDGRIDAIIDGESCDFGLESTVIAINGRNAEILRPGAITKEDLLEVCDSVTVSDAVKDPSKAGDKPASPGMKYKHYSPNAEFCLVDGSEDAFIEYLNSHDVENIGVITYGDISNKFDNCIKKYIYSKTDNTKELCHYLFSFFRKCDDDRIGKLYARLPDDKGQSLALYNRMIRAAGNKIIKL